VNERQPSRGFRPGACQQCGGDAFFDRGDESEWRCLQCGRPLMSYSPVRADPFSLRAEAILRAADMGRATTNHEGNYRLN